MNTINAIQQLIIEKNEDSLRKMLGETWNKVWDESGNLSYAHLRLYKSIEKIRNLIELRVQFQNKNVIDIGCGDGTTLLCLRKYFDITGVGVDISESAVARLGRIFLEDNRLTFIVGDHRELKNILPNQFDIALSFGVIEHFPEYSLALAEGRRVLKANGALVLIQPHLFSFGVTQEYYLRMLGKWKFGKQKDFSCFRYRQMLQSAGFRNVRFMTKPPFADMPMTRILDAITKKIIPFWGHYLYIVGEK